MWEAFAGVASVVGVLAGLIRWLLQEYFKKAAELEDVKKAHTARLLQELEVTVDEHRKEIRSLGIKIESSTKAITDSDKKLQTLTEDLRKFLVNTEEKFSRIETDVIKIGRDLIMLKDRANNGTKKD